MKFKKLMSFYNNKKFIIEEDLPEVGVYLYVYEGGKSVYDCLQDNIKICMEIALEEYGVPFESWKEIDSNENNGSCI